MITAHFNGDLVAHSDMHHIAEKVQALKNQRGACKYGICQVKCETWFNHCFARPEVKSISDFGKCTFAESPKCPQYSQRMKAGKTKKQFVIKAKDYRALSSGAHYLIKANKSKAVFFTLTFPPFKRTHKLTKSFYYDEISNILLIKFLDNFKKTYGCTSYIAVKEYGDENNRVHFHILASFPYINFSVINNYWCACIEKHCEYSINALQTRKGVTSIVKDPFRAIKYVCKYFSKAKRNNGASDTRLIFVSRSLLSLKHGLHDINASEILSDRGYKKIYIHPLKYVTIFRVHDENSFKNLCEDFIYEVFRQEIDTGKTEFDKKHNAYIMKELRRILKKDMI
jgi:hypothetical protein